MSIWFGVRCSVAQMVIERLDGTYNSTNDVGQYPMYNKVGGVVVEGGPADLPDGHVLVYVRPHHIELAAPGALGALPGRIVHRLPGGAVHRLEATSPLALQPVEIEVAASSHLPDGLRPGTSIGLRLRDIRIFPAIGPAVRPNSDRSAELVRPAFP